MRKLNWDKELKKVQKRGLYNPKVRVFSIIAIALLTLGIGLTFSAFSYSSGDRQAFNSTVSKKINVTINVVNGSVDSRVKQVNYNKELSVTVTPNNGYSFDSVSCTNEQSGMYDETVQNLKITPTKDTICTINFRKSNLLSSKILSSNPKKTTIPNFAYGAPNKVLTSNESGLFQAQDDLGTSYYLRGNIVNNYVKFGGYIWRVVRINGDNTIRIIYDGTKAHVNGENDTERSIGLSVFNNSNSDRKYCGYTYDNQYDESGFVISGTDSTMKAYVEDWYKNNLTNKNLDGYVAEEIYCNDTNTYLGEETKTIYYGAYGRNFKNDNNAPVLTCSTTDKSYGGKYKLKVGLLSVDEVAMAGLGFDGTNYYSTSDNYLNVGHWNWLMSSATSSTSEANNFKAASGFVVVYTVTNMDYVRPVINLRANIIVTSGDGTKDNPYQIAID